MNQLYQQLDLVATRYRQRQLWILIACVGCVAVAIGGLLLWLQRRQIWWAQHTGLTLALAAGAGAVVAAVFTQMMFRNYGWLARRIEAAFPNLQERLLTAVEQRPASGRFGLGFLQTAVVQEAIEHAHRNKWARIVSPRSVVVARLSSIVTFLALAAIVGGLIVWRPDPSAISAAARSLLPLGSYAIEVEPGNAELERGRSLIVVAKFPGRVPPQVELVVSDGSGERRQAMSRSLDDPLFGGHVAEVAGDLTYHVEFANQRSQQYRVTVFEYPELLRADAKLEFPSYTGMADKLVEDTRRVSAVEGSKLTWILNLNKPVASAELIDKDGATVSLVSDPENPLVRLATIELAKSQRWKLHLTDDKQRENKNPPELVAKVLPNHMPALKLDLARDARVSPIEEFLVKATVSDDYGLRQYGLSYALAGNAQQELILGESTERQEKQEASHVLDFEAIEAEPDQLLSYYFWAEDDGPDGKPRRTLSDMYFAEVRHFEEIFREGQQPPGGQQSQQQQQQGQGQNSQQAEQLGELQKEIINATWRVIRRETRDQPTAEFDSDVALLHESQTTAMQQAKELGQRLNDPQSQQHLQDVLTHMQTAADELSAAQKGPAVDALQPALAAEQAAYQALLKLRAREHDVTRSQSSSSSSSRSASSQRFQQQLQQLQLQNDQNRYETQRQAEEQQDDAQREVRQILSRLKELARRQQDVNKRLKELQTALQQAETEEEREEIREQLKRLRDQQEELLRDTDELVDRLNEPQNQEQMQEAQQQLEQTRDNVQESSESLQRGEVSQALSAGTRAERQFEQVRDELRQQTANQFSDEMREMRQQARDLDQQQEELSQQLADSQQDQPQTSLRDSSPRVELSEQFQEQNQRLDDLLNRMQETIPEAEDTEPLLAQKLYDSFRETKQRRVGDELRAASELLNRGLDDQARELEESAGEGISQLREDIEQAAESVLGDETEGLRRALSQIDQLSRQLDDEIQRADPEGEGSDARQDGQPGDNPRSQGQEQDPQQRAGQQPGGEQPGSEASEAESESQSRSGRGEQQQDGESSQNSRSQSPSESESQSPGQSQSESQSQSPSQGGGGSSPGQPQSESQDQPSQQQSAQGNEDSQQSQSSQGGGGGQQSGDARQNEGEQEGNRNQNTPRGQPGGRPQPGSLRSQGSAGGTGPQYDGGGRLGEFTDESLGAAPLTGGEFREWSDRLRDVEEMIEDPELSAEAARIRDRARGIRMEYKRHSKEPRWSEVRDMVARPLRQLRLQISEELLRRSAARSALVPIDRDPVPDQFTEQVRRYYEQLGTGE